MTALLRYCCFLVLVLLHTSTSEEHDLSPSIDKLVDDETDVFRTKTGKSISLVQPIDEILPLDPLTSTKDELSMVDNDKKSRKRRSLNTKSKDYFKINRNIYDSDGFIDKKRVKRNDDVEIIPPSRRAGRGLEYDGWKPIDKSDPMSDNPTTHYKPPTLNKVHFGLNEPPGKPKYPIIPQNPTVFVVREENARSSMDNIYGIPNVEYMHIHPESNNVKRFPAEIIPRVDRYKKSPDITEELTNSEALVTDIKSLFPNLRDTNDKQSDFVWPPKPLKESNFADKSFDLLSSDGISLAVISPDTSYYDYTYDYPAVDLDTSSTQYRYASSSIENNSQKSVQEQPRFRYTSSTSPRPGYNYDYEDYDDYEDYEDYKDYKYDLSDYSDTLGVGQESQVERYEESESGTSIYKKVPPPSFLKDPKHNAQKDVVQINELQAHKLPIEWPLSKPWFLIETKAEKPDRREHSISSYIKPESNNGEDTIHYTRSGSILYKPNPRTFGNIQLNSKLIHNYHLDDHMNSYKPANSITANSLSELLQIFKYTHVTEDPELTTQLPENVKKGWRYTQPPTTPTPQLSTRRMVHHNTFRYTTQSSDGNISVEVTSPISPIITTTEIDKSFYEDRVAETNSLDGYLFSDSEASPEYAHPEVKPNVVSVKEKDEGNSKGNERVESKGKILISSSKHDSEKFSTSTTTEKQIELKMDSEAVRRGDFINSKPLLSLQDKIIENKNPLHQNLESTTVWPVYIIYQGHSKVKMYGTNSSEKRTTKDKKSTDFYIITTTQSTIPTDSIETSTYVPFTVPESDDTTSVYYDDTTITPDIVSEQFTDYYYDYDDISQLFKGLLINGNINPDTQAERLNDAFKGMEAPWFRPNLKLPNAPIIKKDETEEIFPDYDWPVNLDEYSRAFYSLLPSSSQESYHLDQPILESTQSDLSSSLKKDTISVEESLGRILFDNSDIKDVNDKSQNLRKSKNHPVPKPILITEINN